MEQPYLTLVLIDFDVHHALVRLMLNHWGYVCLRSEIHNQLTQLESLGIINLVPTVVPVFGDKAVQVSLTELGYDCVLSEVEPKLYIPIEE